MIESREFMRDAKAHHQSTDARIGKLEEDNDKVQRILQQLLERGTGKFPGLPEKARTIKDNFIRR